jgi:hypothetical protein
LNFFVKEFATQTIFLEKERKKERKKEIKKKMNR